MREPEDDGAQHKRRLVHLATPGIPGTYVPFAHFDCVHNQRVSVSNRVCGEVPQPTKQGLSVMKRGADVLSRRLPKTEQEELGLFFQRYTGAKRARYERALSDLICDGLSSWEADVSMFIKCEKTNPEKTNPDPRSIQFRNSKYCVAVASFLKPIEPHLYNLRCQTDYLKGSGRLVGKGMNQVQRARVLKTKIEGFDQPVILSLDMSRFDQHVSLEQLQIEHGVYLSCNSDEYFKWLLSLQLFNRCRSRLGLKYVTRGKRMSGDMNTALGNCIIMLAMLIGAFDEVIKVQYDLLDDGDDCLVIIEEADYERVVGMLPDLMLSMGHELKIENVARTMGDVVWCNSKPVYDGQKWKFVRNPFKVMSTCLVGTRWMGVPDKIRREFVAGLGQCEAALNSGVPVLQEYARALIRNSQGAKVRFDTNSNEWWRYIREIRNRGSDIITEDSRISFHKAFGIDAETQLQYEHTLRNWTIKFSPTVREEVHYNTATWSNERHTFPEFQWGNVPEIK